MKILRSLYLSLCLEKASNTGKAVVAVDLWSMIDSVGQMSKIQTDTMAWVAGNWMLDLKNYLDENSDPRTKGLPFMDSPVPLIILSICYLYFVCKAGPQYMRNRKPYNLKTVITFYNTCQILACIFIIQGLTSVNSLSIFECDTTSTLSQSEQLKIAKIVWWTTMLKITEYLETIFFVLRKKQNQISGLHLYHHISTLSFGWIVSKFAPGVQAVFPIVINSFIHVLMYSYYLIALHGGRELQNKIVPWKRSLTILQMVQFTMIIIHLLSGITGRCEGPMFLLYLMIFNVFVNYFLFYKFYRNTYKKVRSE